MKTRTIFPAAALWLAASAASAAAPGAAAPAAGAKPTVATRSCHLPGVVDALRCVTINVPLDHAKPGAGSIKLHVTVAPAHREGTRGDPVFVLAGGPGQAGSDVIQVLPLVFGRVRATRDIVFIDQRGTGLSGKLDCASKPEHERMTEEQLKAELLACIGTSKAPFGAYTTDASARDLEAVRRALGYGAVNVWGGSYGTRLGQAYARMYPSSVRTLVLDGVAAPDQVIPAGARDAQAALDKLFELCAKDAGCNKAFPTVRADFNALVAKLEAGGIKLSLPDPRTAKQVDFTMTAPRFLGTVHNILYSPADARRLPFLIHNAAQGRWQPFIARQNLATDFGAEGNMAVLMHLAVVCAEDVPRLTPELRKLDVGQLTKTLAEEMPAMCQAMKVPVAAFQAPTRIEAPALLFSGALDPVTPPHRAATAAKYMARAQHIVVDNAGHGVSQLGCAPRLLREFLDKPQATLDVACMKSIPAPTFQLGSAGPQP
ncbi:alpha/beta fold hydrolase [Massilia yuzhufengensis]|uniref:Pimeloyl-ACP methyl ester carboxylesterase n=1 Tax=Massilia yuzhufengensis TaxID=1164594 RepID=A0A1I1KQJ2_9BURK|nr:alpha/beta fold hydrolase [Massilia yuzhufengensis]SFC63067.1 Pimeloyl-ACP methyl ester carboxylesterase [Massilia yuzhufengensis]